MRLRDAIRLGHANITAQKRRSIMMVMVVGVIFGVVCAGDFVLQGIKGQTLDLMLRSTEGEVYLSLAGEQGEVERLVEEKGGEILGELRPVGSYLVLPNELGEKFLRVAPEAVPDDAVAVLLSTSNTSYLAQMSIPSRGKLAMRVAAVEKAREMTLGTTYEIVGVKYYVAGWTQAGGAVDTLALGDRRGTMSNPLNIILEQVPVATSQSYAVAGIGVLKEWDMMGGDVLEGSLSEFGSDASEAESRTRYLVRMPNIMQAERLAHRPGVCLGDMYSCKEKDLAVDDVLAPVLHVVSWMGVMQLAMDVLSAVLLIVAVLVVYFTVVRLIGQEAQTISLDYALGATKRDVHKIYACYVTELGVFASGFAVVLGVGLAIVLSLINAVQLTEAVTLAFGVENYRFWLLGWNWRIGAIILGVWCLMLVCLVGNLWQFSARKLAKRMKK